MRGRAFRTVAVLALALAAGCGPERRAYNVLLVTVDTLRPDHLSCYGYRRHATPHLDALAAEGALFLQAVSDTPWTTPSMASVLTGTYPTLHGFKSTNVNRLAPENLTLAEILKERGFRTAAVIGSFPLDSIYQLDQGFDHYDDEFTTPVWVMPDHEFEKLPSTFLESPEAQRLFVLSKNLNDSRRRDPEVTDAALARLRDASITPSPFLLWVHYFGPHEQPDWAVPVAQRQKRHLDMYDPGVVGVDREVGRLLAALDEAGLRDDTLVVFHADHGESLGEEGLLGHGDLLNEASVRIPLLMRLPGVVAAGVRVPELVRNVDVFPTVLDLLGIEPPGETSGESLVPLVSASLPGRLARWGGGGERVAYLETYYPAHSGHALKVRLPDGRETRVGLIRRGVRTDEWKLVRTEPYPLLDVSRGSLPEVPEPVRQRLVKEELFRLDETSGARRDVIAEHPDVAERMRALLDAHLAQERYRKPIETMELEQEQKLRLEALGYGKRE